MKTGKLTIADLVGKNVSVHWHLRKCQFSVTYKGKVVAHVDHICLYDASFKVRKSGYDRVQRTGRKNVHAFVCGTVHRFSELDTDEPSGYSRVGYDPFKKPYFYHKCNGQQVKDKVNFAIMWHGGIYV